MIEASRDERKLIELALQLATHHVDADARAIFHSNSARTWSRINMAYEFVIAFVTGSSVAAWSIWQAGLGAAMWSLLLGLVAVLNLLKPMLRLSDKIRKCQARASKWNEVALRLQRLALTIRVEGSITPAIESELRNEFARWDEVSQEDDPATGGVAYKRVRAQSEDRFPPEFYWPRYRRPSMGEFQRPEPEPDLGAEITPVLPEEDERPAVRAASAIGGLAEIPLAFQADRIHKNGAGEREVGGQDEEARREDEKGDG